MRYMHVDATRYMHVDLWLREDGGEEGALGSGRIAPLPLPSRPMPTAPARASVLEYARAEAAS